MKTLKKRLSILIAVCFIFGLVGCSIERNQIEKCAELCKPNGGLNNLSKGVPGGAVHCYCVNNAYFIIK